MKKWKDADEVIKMIHELPSELRNVDREMSKKPNFDKWKKSKKTSKNIVLYILEEVNKMDYEISKQLFDDVWNKYGRKIEITDKSEIYSFLNDIVTLSDGYVIVDHFSGMNFDSIEKIEYREPYTLIYWKDFNNLRKKYLDKKISEDEIFGWSIWDYCTYSYMMLHISKIKIIDQGDNIFITFLSNLIPKKEIEKALGLKKENLIRVEENINELYSMYHFLEGEKSEFIKHVCIVNNLPYYNCLIQHKENCTHSGYARSLLKVMILNEVHKRMNIVYESLVKLKENEMDDILSKGNTVRRIMEFLLKYYCIDKGIDIKLADKYSHIDLGKLKKQINSTEKSIKINQSFINTANKLSHDTGEIFTKDDIVRFYRDAQSLIQLIFIDMMEIKLN